MALTNDNYITVNQYLNSAQIALGMRAASFYVAQRGIKDTAYSPT